MENKRKNYACVDDCGRIDNNTMKFSKNDHPFELNLLTLTKKKRENRETPVKQDIIAPVYSKTVHKAKNKIYMPWLKLKMADYISNQIESTTKTRCKELLDGYSDDEENESCGD